jgi:hypothetical protein
MVGCDDFVATYKCSSAEYPMRTLLIKKAFWGYQSHRGVRGMVYLLSRYYWLRNELITTAKNKKKKS